MNINARNRIWALSQIIHLSIYIHSYEIRGNHKFSDIVNFTEHFRFFKSFLRT